MLNTMNAVSYSSPITVDEKNKRLIVDGYPQGTKPTLFGRHLIYLALKKKLEKIWLWALPADVPDFLRCGFRTEGTLFQNNYEEFAVSLAYYVRGGRGHSHKLQSENEIIHSVRTEPIHQTRSLPHGIELKLLNESFAQQISQLLTKVFTSYPSPVGDPQYIRSLMQQGNIFAGAFSQEKLISVAAAYPNQSLKRCEMTDCATIEEYRGHSLSERLLWMLEHEVQKKGSFNVYTLARAQSYGMNRVFHKLGYRYQGRLINNCHIAGSYEDMNLWVR
ncbi:putative beta-lysine N-acetyltransferase [Desulfosporosinus sp. BICA1-9]|uniref:putative beta-lysine N-acetyltransferase n=1 Tax=Desulfosporosinus sp. BICA1-9 TaxID=1531958 RepID=UPI00054B6D68|nr:putative beta-lysine N-acetyltransferase [Desulfosporosinus sp. BICA1-9]KJS46123.1 MAG: acetyltransferase [Peptococcaceae bacterium BRH_c23]KJS83715.1 MAG: acetyltransferase [Desulfosporosinus sp. BICA1-9]HBW33939.1 putative beta-lysine N-acetyltransferase [Desulfosporosinus sp.]